MKLNDTDVDEPGGLSIAWIGKIETAARLISTNQDRILSVKSGNPITIHDEDIGTLLPATTVCLFAESCNWLFTDCKKDGSTNVPWSSVVLRHYAQLSSILGRIGEGKYHLLERTYSILMKSRNLSQEASLGLKPTVVHAEHHKRLIGLATPRA